MFTGLIEGVGRVRALQRTSAGARLTVEAPFAKELSRGESVAVEGACLTALELTGETFTADVSTETLDRTTLGALRPGADVNLERALAVGDRLGGHYVLGHVDGVGKIAAISPLGDAVRIDLEAPAAMAPLFIEKGSICIDGISLTINGVDGARVWVAIIPETRAQTTLARKAAGSRVNLEGDVLGKYVLRALATRGQVRGIDEGMLRDNGWM